VTLPGAGFIQAIDCTDDGGCVAVGVSPDAEPAGIVIAMANGSVGPIQSVPATEHLFGVACSTSCVAGGTSSVAGGVLVPIAHGDPGSAVSVSPDGFVIKVTCTGSHCGALLTSTSTPAIVETQPGARPAIAATAHGPVPAGGTTFATASVTGGFEPTGKVTFTLYGPGDVHCATPVGSSTVDLAANGTATSANVAGGAGGTYNWVASYSGDLANDPAMSACGAAPFTVLPQTMTGRSYGLLGQVTVLGNPLVNVGPTPDTGHVATTATSSTSVPCVANIPGLVSASGLCVSVNTVGFPGRSQAVSTVASALVNVATLSAITIGAVSATSTTTCAGSSGTTTIASLKVGTTVVIGSPTQVAPNTTVNVGVVRLVLNEQVPVGGPDAGLTVNAVHATVNAGAARLDVVVASAESDIGGCP
jgi:hypothetical protein